MPEQLQNQTKLIAVYGRVSSSNQENEGTIETQLSAVNEFSKKNGYTIVQKYTDEGWSGDSIARPALDQLRMDAKKKIWSAVLMYDPDRLARRYSYQELIMDELKEAGIEVIFVTVSAPKNSEDKILYGVRGLFAEYERAKIAERFRLGKVRKANEGHIIASEAPYGYTFITRNSERQGYYEINEIEAIIVRKIFTWVADEGLTLRAIVKRLQNEGILPRKSKRGVWNTSTLSTLLRNKTYIGEAHYGASYAVVPLKPIKKEGYKKIKKTSRRNKPESEWIKISTPKIIEEELFIRVGQRLKSNFEKAVRNTKNEYLLAGSIWCSCGNRRAGEGPQHGKHLYYRCTNRGYCYPLPRTCFEGGVNARIADKLVWQKVSMLMSSPELLTRQAERWLNNKVSSKPAAATDISILRKEIEKLKDSQERYMKAYGANVISLEQLTEYTAPLKEKMTSLDSQIKQTELANNQLNEIPLPKKEEIEEFAHKASHELKNLSFKAKQEIIRSIIEKVVGNQQELIISGFIPVQYLNHVSFCSLHRNRRIAKCR
ncbi:MAG: putative site-specific recombinase, resolvase family [Candidatus Nomurabacteria bacterium]|nr:putative site-specific recombinase, resolvase family [Candidatus Nomurabacteria bacterium]